MDLATTIEDYKAISMNVMHSSMKITDEFYSNLNDQEIRTRIGALGKHMPSKEEDQEILNILQELLRTKHEHEEH